MKLAKQKALNHVRDMARRDEQMRQASNAAHLAYVQAVDAALQLATGAEVAEAAGKRSRTGLYRALGRIKRPA